MVDDFLDELANRKYKYYRILYVSSPQAYTMGECYERIVFASKYQEVIEIIESLPLDFMRYVNKRFEGLKNS